MRAVSLRLVHLRNHFDTVITDIAPGVNVFTGQNGAGKTSILEALSMVTLTKSFSTSSDAALLQNGTDRMDVDARFVSDLDAPLHSSLELTVGPPIRKTLHVNSERLRSMSDLIGRAPVVVLTPEDKVITSGPPSERRRFLNLVLSQASRAYLEHEIEFKRALKQRNSILADAKLARRSLQTVIPLLEPWTELVIAHAAQIMERRERFANEFAPYLVESYSSVSSSKENPAIQYLPMGLEEEGYSSMEELLRTEHLVLATDELRRGTSLIGSHRDDLLLYINPYCPARDHASQGQHKTLLVAMKLAEFRYLADATAETPILLLDDLFSELDAMRSAKLLQLVEQFPFGQTFITSTNSESFERSLDFGDSRHRLFTVENGMID